MKLTKGRIHKLLKARKQSFKASHSTKPSNQSSSKPHNFTVRAHKKPVSLHNKTLSSTFFTK